MSMGYGANYVDVIEEKKVKEICSKEFNILQDAIDETDLTWEDVSRSASYEDVDKECGEKIYKAYIALLDTFEKKTGLQLGLAFHDTENDGDIYDDVKGTYWWVDGMYELTSSGKKMQKFVKRECYAYENKNM